MTLSARDHLFVEMTKNAEKSAEATIPVVAKAKKDSVEKGRETAIVMENVLAILSAEVTTVMALESAPKLIVADNPEEMKAKTAQWTMSVLALLFAVTTMNAEIHAQGHLVAAFFRIIVRRVRGTAIMTGNVGAPWFAEVTTVMEEDLGAKMTVAGSPKEMKEKTAQQTMSALVILFVAPVTSAEVHALGQILAANFLVIVRRVRGTAIMMMNVKALWFAEKTTVMDQDSRAKMIVALNHATMTLTASIKNATLMTTIVGLIPILTALTGQSAARICRAQEERAIVMTILIAGELLYAA